MNLRPYQEQAVDFLYENDRAMILAPVGAGKTAIALTAMDELISKCLVGRFLVCLLYTSPSPRDRQKSRMPSSA